LLILINDCTHIFHRQNLFNDCMPNYCAVSCISFSLTFFQSNGCNQYRSTEIIKYNNKTNIDTHNNIQSTAGNEHQLAAHRRPTSYIKTANYTETLKTATHSTKE
jgi:hypothetical protein